MRQPSRDDLRELLADHAPPCISLYQPTHRTVPDVHQDPIRFKNLLRELEDRLSERLPGAEPQPYTEPFRRLLDDEALWKNPLDGLAVFGSRDAFRVFRLQRAVEELVTVADTFHVKPLLRVTQSADRFHVLCITERTVELFEGNRYALDRVDLTEQQVSERLSDALGAEMARPTTAAVAYADAGGPYKDHGEPGVRYGNASRKTEEKIDTEQFFNIVDREIYEHYSAPTGYPLLLCGLPEQQALYRSASNNPHLAVQGIDKHPQSFDNNELRNEAWHALEPIYNARLKDLIDNYHLAVSHGLGADDIFRIAEALRLGRVSMLLVEDDRRVPGRYDRETASIELSDAFRDGCEDILDDLAEHTLRIGGKVIVTTGDRMPTRTGIAAAYRF